LKEYLSLINHKTPIRMKKMFFTAAVACFVMSSCKKDYTCKCTGTGLPDQYSNIEIKDAKKKDAEEACNAFNTTYKIYSSDINCSLN
jgi:hypothetical protein